MERTVIGYSRMKRKNPRLTEEICYALGLFAVAGMLVLPMRSSRTNSRDAVMVMSSAVTEADHEELAEPEKRPVLSEDWSVFDEIGEFFASLIFGE